MPDFNFVPPPFKAAFCLSQAPLGFSRSHSVRRASPRRSHPGRPPGPRQAPSWRSSGTWSPSCVPGLAVSRVPRVPVGVFRAGFSKFPSALESRCSLCRLRGPVRKSSGAPPAAVTPEGPCSLWPRGGLRGPHGERATSWSLPPHFRGRRVHVRF